VAENIPGGDMPMFRNLWENIRKDMPKKGRGKAEGLDPLALPTRLQTALQALYGHYEKTFELWKEAGIVVPPCFIIVCNNTSTSKLVCRRRDRPLPPRDRRAHRRPPRGGGPDRPGSAARGHEHRRP
jgi:hypothetical protein